MGKWEIVEDGEEVGKKNRWGRGKIDGERAEEEEENGWRNG